MLADLTHIDEHGGDPNNHNVAVAGLLTGGNALQRADVSCTGGGRSIDQEQARRSAVPGRFASRAYGGSYVPNAEVAPFSFLDAGVPTPIVGDPARGLGHTAHVLVTGSSKITVGVQMACDSSGAISDLV